MHNKTYEDPNGYKEPDGSEEQSTALTYPKAGDMSKTLTDNAKASVTSLTHAASYAKGVEEQEYREACRRLLASIGSNYPTIVRGILPPGPVHVHFGALILSPIHRLAEQEGLFYKDGNYHGRNPVEEGATEDGFTIFAEGHAYDRKLGKKYSRREMGEFAFSNGFGNHFSVHEKGTVRCNPAPASVGSSSGGSSFNWERAQQWYYRGENNHVLFLVGRIDTPASNGVTKKEIRQRRPDGQGGWIYNLEGVRRVLYRLPEVSRAQTVFIVEGEKAADELNKQLKAEGLLGKMVATTTSGGAGNAHLTQFQDALAGKTVVVLPDNDQPGQRYADHFCSTCIYSSAVKRIDLPGLPAKGDVVDYFTNGGPLQTLLQMVEKAPKLEKADLKGEETSTPLGTATQGDAGAPFSGDGSEKTASPPTNTATEPPPQQATPPTDGAPSAQTASDAARPSTGRKRRFRFLSIGELFNFPDPEWLIKGFLVTKTLSLITGPHSSFKSFVALDMALCIATGRDWHGHKTQAGEVVYVAAEGADGLQKRIGAWLFHHDIEEYPANFYAYPRAIAFADEETVEQLVSDLEADGIRPALIVVDTLARCTLGLDENSARDMGSFIDGLNFLSKKLGAHMMVVHHNNKNGGYRGSSSLPAAVDTHFAITRKDDELSLSTEKQKDAAQEDPLAFETHSVLFPHPKHPSEKLSSIVLKLTSATSSVAGYDLSPMARKVLLVLVDEFGNGGASATDWEKACKKLADSNHRRTRRLLVSRGAVTLKNKQGKAITKDEFEALSSDEQKKVVYYPAQNSNWLKDVLRRRDNEHNREEQDVTDGVPEAISQWMASIHKGE